MFLVLISLIRFATKLYGESNVIEESDCNKYTYMIGTHFQSTNLGSVKRNKV
jgi:hypothetical protein